MLVGRQRQQRDGLHLPLALPVQAEPALVAAEALTFPQNVPVETIPFTTCKRLPGRHMMKVDEVTHKPTASAWGRGASSSGPGTASGTASGVHWQWESCGRPHTGISSAKSEARGSHRTIARHSLKVTHASTLSTTPHCGALTNS